MLYFRLFTLTTLLISILGCSTDTLVPTQPGRDHTDSVNHSPFPLHGAEVFSHDKVLFGKFVIRMKMVSKPGVVSSFFAYDNESWVGGIPWREIDIESIGKQENLLQTNLITGEASARVHSENLHIIDNIEEFHEYSLVWTPDEITWQVDGETVHQELAVHSLQVREMRDSPQSYRMNLWVAESVDWVGKFDASTLPLQQTIDWIEYYRFENGVFTLAWRDDFDYFDSNRWGKGDWGFETNIATFSPMNANIVDGHLVLSLTPAP
ncbi:family 16 glycosylhydrolase [Vibrio hangzhouensis]|uniref:Beta-glucanase n=1 Tax=Vibrio hangzhouensis TaxID=462991 RepID=A0A1H5VCC6_9VIBR|nr:family 16 glycosylhydrolase [Vibrio hangzhouensis]SEF84969.1 Glycosyl hydrolases family 16 [Vibrio hangzhouensis]